MARYYYTKDKNKTVQRTRYYYGLDNDNQLYHFGFKIPDIKLPDIGKIADDVKKNVDNLTKGVAKGLDDTVKAVSKGADDAAKAVSKGASDAAKGVGNVANNLVKGASDLAGGLFGREWKDHKWIARKRNAEGKWIYDYGNGFPGEGSIAGQNGSVSPDDVKLYEPSLVEKFLTPLVGLGKALTGGNIDDVINGGKEFVGGFLALGKRLQSNAAKEGAEADSTGFKRKKDGDKGKDYDLANTNPEWDLKDGGSQNNCPCCSFAYDLRRRGYEVTAKQTRTGLPEGQISSFYKNPQVKEVKAKTTASPNMTVQDYRKKHGEDLSKAVEKQFESEPDNSRGVCWMNWNTGGGHIVAYEKENGETHLYDAQSGQKLNISDYVNNAQDFKYYRTDNLEPNYDMMKKVVE